MSSIRTRRRRRTIAMFATTIVVLAVMPVLGYVGARAVLDSTGGRDANADALPVKSFPSTPTALFATVDTDGVLASVAVLVLDPAGVGGKVVTVPVNADVGFAADARRSLQDAYSEGGLDELQFAIESLLLIPVNYADVLDRGELTGMLLPFEPLTVTLTSEVVPDDGEPINAGTAVLDAANAALLLTVPLAEGEVVDSPRQGNVDGFWTALTTAIGTGRPTSQQLEFTPATFDEFVSRLFAAPVESRGLPVLPLTGSENPDHLDVVALDRAESVFVFASIAPGSMSAPASGPIVRLEAPAGYDAQVKATIAKLLFLFANVVSVDATVPVQAETVFLVPDASNRVRAQSLDTLFDEVVFADPVERIETVDLTIVLGTDYLESVEL